MIFHGGEFTQQSGRKYLHGHISFIDSVYIYVGRKVKCLGYSCYMDFYFYYKVPNLCLDLGLRSLIVDHDFENLFDHVRDGVKLMEIYVEHWVSSVFLNSIPSQHVVVGPDVGTSSSFVVIESSEVVP
ncbi:hypothetical protein Hanom_Chr16g01515761 [Helianthus anomalus]